MAKAHESNTGEETLPKGETADDIREVTSALKGDLTKLAGPKAGKTIQHFEDLLEKLPGVKAIHTELGKLREHVTSSDPDGAAIAKLLHGLSTKTAKVAEDTGGVVGTALKSLAGALEKAGTSLTEGGDDDSEDGRKNNGKNSGSSTSKKSDDDEDDDKSDGRKNNGGHSTKKADDEEDGRKNNGGAKKSSSSK